MYGELGGSPEVHSGSPEKDVENVTCSVGNAFPMAAYDPSQCMVFGLHFKVCRGYTFSRLGHR